MIIPKKHHIIQLVIADVHHRCRHAGLNHVLAQVSNCYWVIDGWQEVIKGSCEQLMDECILVPLFENESLCETFHIKMSLIIMK